MLPELLKKPKDCKSAISDSSPVETWYREQSKRYSPPALIKNSKAAAAYRKIKIDPL